MPEECCEARVKHRGWISDGLGCNIRAFPTALDGDITAKYFRTILEE